MPVVQDDVGEANDKPGNTAPPGPPIRPTAPASPTAQADPLLVYSTQVRLRVHQAIRYINQELGFEALRPTFNRRTADVIVRPTPWRVQQKARERPGEVAQSYVSYIPASEDEARSWINVVYVDPSLQEGAVAAFRAAIPRIRGGPAAHRVVRNPAGTLSMPPSGGAVTVATHELGHTLGLIHDDDFNAENLWAPGTIMTGGNEISEEQRQYIENLLGASTEILIPPRVPAQRALI